MNEGNNDTVVGLTVQEKKFLLNLARQTIIHSLMEKKPDSVEPPSEKLKEKFGAFVTLHKKKKEIPDLEIEISVLSPLKKIEDTKEIVIGTHGIIIQKGMRRGLLLPQVATEWNWDREEFLRQTCFKAGLMADAWREPETEIFIFSAEIFSEKELSGL
ncbi:MAG: TIGR00296 family protein [Calditrichia bacterium]